MSNRPSDWHGFPVHTYERMEPDEVHIVPPLCGAQDSYTSGRCSLAAGHDGQHYAVVGAGARQWGSESPKSDLRERIAIALFDRWEREGEDDAIERGESYERETWEGLDEDDRNHWRGWAHTALRIVRDDQRGVRTADDPSGGFPPEVFHGDAAHGERGPLK